LKKIQVLVKSAKDGGYFANHLTLLRMRHAADRSCRENQNIFYVQNFFWKLCRLRNVEKYGSQTMIYQAHALHAE